MKFTCRQSIIGEILQTLVKIPYPKTNLEVLRGVLLEVVDGTLILYRTNLDIAISKQIPVKNSQDGKVVVDMTKLSQYIQTLATTEDVTFEVVDSNLLIMSKQGKVSFNLLDPEEFPSPQDVSLETESVIDVSIFNKGIQSTFFACAKSGIRPEFASVYVFQKKTTKEVCFVATDSFRLSEYTEGYEFNEFKDFLIPATVAQNLIKVTQGFEGEISLGYGDGQLVIKKDGYVAISRLTDAIFPDYTKIIPTEFQCQLQLFKKDLLAIFKQVQIFSDTYNQVVLTLTSDGELLLTSHNQYGEGGEHKIVASLEKKEGFVDSEIKLKFNYMYFMEALQHVPGEIVTVFVAGPQKPLVITDDKENNYLALIMPMSK